MKWVISGWAAVTLFTVAIYASLLWRGESIEVSWYWPLTVAFSVFVLLGYVWRVASLEKRLDELNKQRALDQRALLGMRSRYR